VTPIENSLLASTSNSKTKAGSMDRNEGEALEAANPLWPMQLPLPDFLTDIGIYTSLQRIRCRNPWQSTAVDLVSFWAQGSSGYPRCMGTANLY
jgi:hypothetical protein